MDSLSQAVLGAAVGEAVAGKKAGFRAPLWGVVIATIPDLDVLGRHFMDTVDALDFHRGMTHSILFAIVISPLLGYGLHQLHQTTGAGWKRWTLLAFLCLFTHALLDCFTTWGTKLFWPFNDYKVAFKSIFVIDPLYTLPFLIMVVWMMFLPSNSKKRRVVNYVGLTVSTFYLLLTVVVKQQVNQVFERSLSEKGIKVVRYETKPSPMNIILWAANIEIDNGFYIGYYSFLDDDQKIEYHFFPKNHHLLDSFSGEEKVAQLIKVVEGWFTVEDASQGIILNDLRFGQSAGWERGQGQFVFAYNIFRNSGRTVIREVEKDFKDGRKVLQPLWDRMMGKNITHTK